MKNYSDVRLLNHGDIINPISYSECLTFRFRVVSIEINNNSFLVWICPVNYNPMALSQESKEFIVIFLVFWSENIFYSRTCDQKLELINLLALSQNIKKFIFSSFERAVVVYVVYSHVV
jgi:hypothetical protein